jgi:AcrR family transcriptional regulator
MKEKEDTTKSALIKAFEESETKSVSDLCRIVGVARFTFYYHFNKDAKFREEIITKQKEFLTQKLANF